MTDHVVWVPVSLSSSATSSSSSQLLSPGATGVCPVRVLRPTPPSPLSSSESSPSSSVFSVVGAHVPGSSTITLTDGTVLSAHYARLPVLRPQPPAAASTTTTTTAIAEQLSLRWLPARDGAVPPGAVVAAHDGRASPIYLARVRVPDQLQHPHHRHEIVASRISSDISSTDVNPNSPSPNSTTPLDMELGNHNTQAGTTTSPLISVTFPYAIAQLQPLYKAALTTYPLTPVSTNNKPWPMQYATHAYDVLCVVLDDVVVPDVVVIDIASMSARRRQQHVQCSPCTSANDSVSLTSQSRPSSTSSSTSTSASSSAHNLFILPPSLDSDNTATSTTASVIVTTQAAAAHRRHSDAVVSTLVNDTTTHPVTIPTVGAPTNTQFRTFVDVATRLRALCLARRQQQREEELQLQQQQYQRRRQTRQHRIQLPSTERNQNSSTGVVTWLDANLGCSVAGAIQTDVSRCPGHRHRQAHGREGKISYQIARRRPRPHENTAGYTADLHHDNRTKEFDFDEIFVGNLAFGACGFAWVPDHVGNAMCNAVACCDYQLLAIVRDDEGEDDDSSHSQHQQDSINNHSRVSWKPIDLDLLSRHSLSPSSSSSRAPPNGRLQNATGETMRGRRRRRREQERLCADGLVVAGHTMRDEGATETYVARVRIGDVEKPATYVPSLCAALCVTGDGHGRIVARRKFELLCVRGHTAAETKSVASVRSYRREKQRRRVGEMMLTMATMMGETTVGSSGIAGFERLCRYRGGQGGHDHRTGLGRRNEFNEDDYGYDYDNDDDYDDDYDDEDDDDDDDDDESDCLGKTRDLIEQPFPVQPSRRAMGTEFESSISRSPSIKDNSTHNNSTNSSSSSGSSSSIVRYSRSHTINYQTFDQFPSTPHHDENRDDDQDSYNMAQYGLHWVHCTDGDIPRNAVVAFEEDATLMTVSTPTTVGCTYVARLCVSGHDQDRNGLDDNDKNNGAQGVDVDLVGDVSRCYVAAGVRHKEVAVATIVTTRRSRRHRFGGRGGRRNGNDNNGTERYGTRLQLSRRVSSEYDVLTMETSSDNNQQQTNTEATLRWVPVQPQESGSNEVSFHATNRSPLLPENVYPQPHTRWRIPGNAVAVCANSCSAMDMGHATRGASDADVGSVMATKPGYVLRGRRLGAGRPERDGTQQGRRRERWRVGTFEARAWKGHGNREGCEGRTVAGSQSDCEWGRNYLDCDWECEVLCIFPSNANTMTNAPGQQASAAATFMSSWQRRSPICVRIDVGADRHHRGTREEEEEGCTMLVAPEREMSGMVLRVDDGLIEDELCNARRDWRMIGGDGGTEGEWEGAERKRARAKMLAIAAEVGMCVMVGIYLVWMFGLWPSGS